MKVWAKPQTLQSHAGEKDGAQQQRRRQLSHGQSEDQPQTNRDGPECLAGDGAKQDHRDAIERSPKKIEQSCPRCEQQRSGEYVCQKVGKPESR
jgi:hypothetical protein